MMNSPIKSVRALRADDSARDALRTLKEQGAAVLVDDDHRPIGVITFSDMARLSEAVKNARRAQDLFELGREIYTVPVDASPVEMAKAIVERGLKTGIVAVDEKRRYVGYVFVRDLRELVDDVRKERERVAKSLETLRKEHPASFARVERIIKSGSNDS